MRELRSTCLKLSSVSLILIKNGDFGLQDMPVIVSGRKLE